MSCCRNVGGAGGTVAGTPVLIAARLAIRRRPNKVAAVVFWGSSCTGNVSRPMRWEHPESVPLLAAAADPGEGGKGKLIWHYTPGNLR